MTPADETTSPAVAAWRRHLEFEPDEARALGFATAAGRPPERLVEQVEFYRGILGELGPEGAALERLARLAVRRFDRGDELCNLERSWTPHWLGSADPTDRLRAQEELLREGIRAGRTPDAELVAQFIDAVLPAARDAADDEPAREAWERHLAVFRDELLPAARPGTWRLGAEEYAWRLQNMGVFLDPVEAGRDMLEAVHEQMLARAGTHRLGDAIAKVNAAATERLPNGGVVAAYRAASERCVAWLRSHDWFALPDDFEVRFGPLPAGSSVVTHAGNVPAPLFGAGDGVFQLLDDPDRHPRAWVLPLAVHEGVPGHYLQSWLWQERFGRRADRAAPAFVSFTDPLAAERHDWGAMLAIEGWAVHAEDLALRDGLHDETGALVVLGFHAIRCIRAIVDAELHAGRMEVTEAARMFCEQAGLDEANARREVRRCQRVPTQPATYLLGWLRIEGLLEAACAAGDTLADAHLDLLGHGPALPDA